MTQDFAKPSTTRKPGSKKPKSSSSTKKLPPQKKGVSKPKATLSKVTTTTPKRGKFIFLLFVLLCLFIYGLYLLQNIPPTQVTNHTQSTLKRANPPANIRNKDKQPAVKEKRFKFYDILPETEVIAPQVDEYHYTEKNAITDFYYFIQTGSFRNIGDAEKQKAQIAFQGLKAKITSVTNSSGTQWHRVMTGPFHNRSTMNAALDKLVSINIEPLVKRIPKDG